MFGFVFFYWKSNAWMKEGTEKRSRWVEGGEQEGWPIVMMPSGGSAASGDPSAKLSVWTPSWSHLGAEGRWKTRGLWSQSLQTSSQRHYSKKLLLQLKCTCRKQACVHTLMSKVCGSWRLSTALPTRLSFCSMLQTHSGKKGGIILPFGGCRGEERSRPARHLSLARTSCSAAALLTLKV